MMLDSGHRCYVHRTQLPGDTYYKGMPVMTLCLGVRLRVTLKEDPRNPGKYSVCRDHKGLRGRRLVGKRIAFFVDGSVSSEKFPPGGLRIDAHERRRDGIQRPRLRLCDA